MDETETDDPAIIGDEAHIIAKEPTGPRGDSDLSSDDRDKYDNLILLCKNHHKLIDDQPHTYTTEKIKEMKRKHIERIRSNPGFDQLRQRDDEVYATYIDKWIEMAELDNWNAWSSYILGGDQPSMLIEQYNKLKELDEYILSRIWPKRYPEIEEAFINFMRVLNDFLLTFDKYKTKIFQDGEDYHRGGPRKLDSRIKCKIYDY